MEEKQINETILELVKSFQETNQAMAASIVAAQERNMKLVQGVYQHWKHSKARLIARAY